MPYAIARLIGGHAAPGGFRFDLKARNGETIAQSETYTRKASALKGIKSVRKNAKKAKLRDETQK